MHWVKGRVGRTGTVMPFSCFLWRNYQRHIEFNDLSKKSQFGALIPLSASIYYDPVGHKLASLTVRFFISLAAFINDFISLVKKSLVMFFANRAGLKNSAWFL